MTSQATKKALKKVQEKTVKQPKADIITETELTELMQTAIMGAEPALRGVAEEDREEALEQIQARYDLLGSKQILARQALFVANNMSRAAVQDALGELQETIVRVIIPQNATINLLKEAFDLPEGDWEKKFMDAINKAQEDFNEQAKKHQKEVLAQQHYEAEVARVREEQGEEAAKHVKRKENGEPVIKRTTSAEEGKDLEEVTEETVATPETAGI